RWRRIDVASDDARMAVGIKHEGNAEARAHAIPKDEARTEMGKQLISNDGSNHVTVGVGFDERAIGVVAHGPEDGSTVTLQIERFENEPIASAFRRIEVIDRKAGLLAKGNPRRGERSQSRDCGNEITVHSAILEHGT